MPLTRERFTPNKGQKIVFGLHFGSRSLFFACHPLQALITSRRSSSAVRSSSIAAINPRSRRRCMMSTNDQKSGRRLVVAVSGRAAGQFSPAYMRAHLPRKPSSDKAHPSTGPCLAPSGSFSCTAIKKSWPWGESSCGTRGRNLSTTRLPFQPPAHAAASTSPSPISSSGVGT